MFFKEITRCPVCQEVLQPHELALYHSGKGNLVRLHTQNGPVWVHPECAERFVTRSDLVKYVSGGSEDQSWLE